MKGYKLVLEREVSTGVQTIGTLHLYKDEVLVEKWKTLELPWRNNQRQISCIPKGTYIVTHRKSVKYGKHLHVENVPNREYILIHAGNYVHQTLGCILIGKSWGYVNQDNILDVVQSKIALKEIVEKLKESRQTPLIIQ